MHNIIKIRFNHTVFCYDRDLSLCRSHLDNVISYTPLSSKLDDTSKVTIADYKSSQGRAQRSFVLCLVIRPQ